MNDTDPLNQLLQRWSEMITSASPSVEPFILAGFASVFIFVVLCLWNMKALLNFISVREEGKKVSALAVAAWLLSIVSPWAGPLLVIGTPLSFLMGIIAWIRLPREETLVPPTPSYDNSSTRIIPISHRRSVIPARMAVINSVGVLALLGVMIAAAYLAFGTVLREILWEMWQYKGMFTDYIVT
jgi:hypothetical protein